MRSARCNSASAPCFNGARTKVGADALLRRLGTSLRALRHLYGLARKVLDGDEAAAARFRDAVERIGGVLPKHAGDVGTLTARAGRRSIRGMHQPAGHGPARRMFAGAPAHRDGVRDPVFGEGGHWCAVLRFDGVTALYLAAHNVYGRTRPGADDGARARAFDVLAALSLQQGHMDNLNGALVHGGLDGLGAVVDRGERAGDPYLTPGFGGDPIGPEPGSDGDPWGPDPGPDDGPSWPGTFPGGATPPDPEGCVSIREACEAMLIDQINTGLPPIPNPPRSSAWADNIGSIELLGICAGGTMIIHGHGFGDVQPPNVQLVMTVNGDCAVVHAARWSDTEIVVTLPPGVMPGPVGFYDTAAQEGERTRYNHEAARFNAAARDMMTASKCLGQPLDLETFRPILRSSVPCPLETPVNIVIVGLPIIRSLTVATDTDVGRDILAEPDDELVRAHRPRAVHLPADGDQRLRLADGDGPGARVQATAACDRADRGHPGHPDRR